MIDWIPTDKQKTALARTEFEILYGGSRGGGKTDAGMAFLLYNVHHPKFRGLVIRRNADDLKDWIDRATTFYKRVGGEKTGNPAEFKFPSGAIIRTGHLKDASAYTKYMGHEYQNIIVEELTHIAREDDYMKLLASCRSTIPDIKPQIFCTTNPGSIGHDWVKKRFLVPADPEIPFVDAISGRSRIYIPAQVYDNPHIMDNDPEYVKYLESLPPTLKKQWLEGSWDDFEIEGAIFGQEMMTLKQNGQICRVSHDPLLPVETWWDLGLNDYNVIGFVQKVGREVRIIDYLQTQFTDLRSLLYELKKREEQQGYDYGMFVFPHDIAVHEYSTGQSRIESFKIFSREIWGREMVEYQDYRIVPRMQKDNVDGIDAARQLLQFCYFDEVKCAEWIYALKSYHRDRIEGTNIFKSSPTHDEHSHGATAFMYGALLTENFIKQRQDEQRKIMKRHIDSILPQRDAVPDYLTGENTSKRQYTQEYMPNYLTGE